MVNFCQAESTNLGCGVVGGGPGNDVPGDVVGDIHILKLPDMTAQLSALSLDRVLEVRGVLAVPSLEVLSDTSVSLNSPVIQPFYRSSVHNILGCALRISQAGDKMFIDKQIFGPEYF